MSKNLLRKCKFPLLILLNTIFFILLLVTRDIRFVSLLRDNNSEFKDIALMCTDFPACFRVVPSWLGHIAEYVLGKISLMVSINPDPFSSNPITIENRLSMILVLVSLSFRLACFLIVWIFLRQVFNSSTLAHIALIFFQISLISPQSKLLGNLVSLLTENQRVIEWSSRSNLVYFVYFDYFALAVSLLVILNLSRIKDFNLPQLFLLGLILFLSFDFLPIFLALILTIERVINSLQKAIVTVLPGALICISALLFSSNDEGLTNTFYYYSENNLSQALAIPFLLAIVLTPPAMLGVFFRKLIEKYFSKLDFQSLVRSRRNMQSAIIALTLIHILSLFTSNFLGEFARQSIVLQLLVFIFFGTQKFQRFDYGR